jgi:hypothetical protein
VALAGKGLSKQAFGHQCSVLARRRVDGRRLLVFAEQGLGDVIQFARYLPLVAHGRCLLTFLTEAKLARLLRPMMKVRTLFTDISSTFSPAQRSRANSELVHSFGPRIGKLRLLFRNLFFCSRRVRHQSHRRLPVRKRGRQPMREAAPARPRCERGRRLNRAGPSRNSSSRRTASVPGQNGLTSVTFFGDVAERPQHSRVS